MTFLKYEHETTTMATTQLRRRKESLLALVEITNQEHPMLQSFKKTRESVNVLLRHLWSLEKVWPKDHLMTSSLSSILDQLVRSATSVTANMQEGFGKASRESLGVFLRIARGSLYETIDHLITLGIMIENTDLFTLVDPHATVVEAWRATQQLFDEEFMRYTQKSIDIVDKTITHENELSKKRKVSTIY